jgi:hypothetical protein
LRNYVRAIGGDLEFVVRFPEQQPVHLNGLGDVFEPALSRGPAKPKRVPLKSRKAARRA